MFAPSLQQPLEFRQGTSRTREMSTMAAAAPTAPRRLVTWSRSSGRGDHGWSLCFHALTFHISGPFMLAMVVVDDTLRKRKRKTRTSTMTRTTKRMPWHTMTMTMNNMINHMMNHMMSLIKMSLLQSYHLQSLSLGKVSHILRSHRSLVGFSHLQRTRNCSTLESAIAAKSSGTQNVDHSNCSQHVLREITWVSHSAPLIPVMGVFCSKTWPQWAVKLLQAHQMQQRQAKQRVKPDLFKGNHEKSRCHLIRFHDL